MWKNWKLLLVPALMMVEISGGFCSGFPGSQVLSRLETPDPGIPAVSQAQAVNRTEGSFQFNCYSVDDNAPYNLEKVRLEVKPDKPILLELFLFHPITETYVIDTGYSAKPGTALEGFLKLDCYVPATRDHKTGSNSHLTETALAGSIPS